MNEQYVTVAVAFIVGWALTFLFYRYRGARVHWQRAGSRSYGERGKHAWIRADWRWHRYTEHGFVTGAETAAKNMDSVPYTI